jgi:cyanophycin synthetase
MAYCGGVDIPDIRDALRSFSSSYDDSPGRLNVSDRHGFRVLLDYAHNPAGLKALGEVVNGLRGDHRRCIGVIGIAGDRRDQDIRSMGRAAAGIFDEVILKEDHDQRGRGPGEAAALLREGLMAEAFDPDRIIIVLDEQSAVRNALSRCRQGDLLVIAADAIDEVWHLVETWAPDTDVGPAGHR